MRYILNSIGPNRHPTSPLEPAQLAPDIDTCCETDLLTDKTVARKAYLNYLINGSKDGNDVRDWLEAESHLHIDAWSVPDNLGSRSHQ